MQIDVIVIVIIRIIVIDFIIMLEIMEMCNIVRDECTICVHSAWHS